MKQRYFTIQTILLLVFGLISCSPDKQTAEPPAQPQSRATVEIKNLDETIQRIKDTQQTRVSSSIVITFENENIIAKSVHSITSCKTNFKQELLEKEVTFENANSLIIKDLLPPEVFAPTDKVKRQVICQFYLTMKSPNSGDILIKLDNIQVNDTDTHVDLELPFLKEGGQKHFMKSELSQQRVDSPMGRGTVISLCENSSFSHFINEESLQINELFNDLIFEKQNLEKCKILMRDEDTNETWVSGDFYIQNKTPNLTYSYDYNLNSSVRFGYNQNAALILSVQNQSDVTAYFTVNLNNPNMRLQPIFKVAADPTPLQISPFTLSAKWQIANPEVEKKVKKTGTLIYKLRPGKVLEIELIINAKVDCSMNHVPKNEQLLHCGVYPVFSGYNYYIKSFPVISESVYSNYNLGKWRNKHFLPRLSKKAGSFYRIWTASQNVKQYCGQNKVLADPNNKVKPFTGLGGKRKCHRK